MGGGKQEAEEDEEAIWGSTLADGRFRDGWPPVAVLGLAPDSSVPSCISNLESELWLLCRPDPALNTSAHWALLA